MKKYADKILITVLSLGLGSILILMIMFILELKDGSILN